MAPHGKRLLALAVSLLALTLAAEARCLGRDVGEGECGPGFGSCENGLCCSQFGFCGKGEQYCGNGCKPDYGNCDGDDRARGRGVGEGECGPGFGSCKNGLCCSRFGFCGSDEQYCGNGCQPEYGNCGSENCLRASTGKASYYNTYIPSACYGYDENRLPRNRMMAAVSDGHPDLWKNGEGCGKHYRIRCEGKGCRNGDAITIEVVDRCPNGCKGRVFDLSVEAFGAIADKNEGEIKVQYEPVNNANAIPWEQKKLIAEV